MKIFLYLLYCIIDASGVMVGLGCSPKEGFIGTIFIVVIILTWTILFMKISKKTDYKRYICAIFATLVLILMLILMVGGLILIELFIF